MLRPPEPVQTPDEVLIRKPRGAGGKGGVLVVGVDSSPTTFSIDTQDDNGGHIVPPDEHVVAMLEAVRTYLRGG